MRRLRRWLPPCLATTAAAAIVVLVVMAGGAERSFRLGPIDIGLHDYTKALSWGASASVLLLLLCWERVAWRRLAMLLAALVGITGVVNFGIHASPIVTDSDLAIGELYVELATRGRLFLGAYSRFGWHHPGPLVSYLNAPLYAWGGHRAATLYATAVAINLTSLGAIAWIITREWRALMAAAVVGGLVAFAWRLDWFLASPWNAHIAVLPSLAFVVAAAAVASGRPRLFPLMAVFGSVAAQSHVGFAPLVALLSIAVVIAHVARARRGHAPPSRVPRATAWLVALLWLFPISEAVSHQGGNVAMLWRFFVIEGSYAHSLRDAVVTGSYGLMGLFRSDLALPWGGHFDVVGSWTIPGALVELVLLVVVASAARRGGRTFERSLALMALAGSLIGVWGLTRIRGDILSHDLFRLEAAGALNAAVLVAAGLSAGLRAFPIARAERLAGPAGCVAALVVGLFVGLRDLRDITASELWLQRHSPVAGEHTAIRDYMAGEAKSTPLIRIGAERWGDAAGVVLRLLQDDINVAVTDVYVPMFSEALAPTGREDVAFTFVDRDAERGGQVTPGRTAVFEEPPFLVDAEATTPSAR